MGMKNNSTGIRVKAKEPVENSSFVVRLSDLLLKNTICGVLSSRYTKFHTLTSMLMSFVFPLCFFSIILIPASTSVALWSSKALSIIVMSPAISAFLSPLMIPVTLPENFDANLVLTTKYIDNFKKCFIFFNYDGIFQYALVRNMFIGTYAAVFFIPIALCVTFLLNAVVAPIYFVLLASMYISFVSGFIVPLSIVSTSIEPNHKRVLNIMSRNPNKLKRFIFRVCKAPIT